VRKEAKRKRKKRFVFVDKKEWMKRKLNQKLGIGCDERWGKRKEKRECGRKKREGERRKKQSLEVEEEGEKRECRVVV
jgi:hypothetical protein